MPPRLRIALAIAVAVVAGSGLVAYGLKAAVNDDGTVARPEEGTSLAGALGAATAAFPPYDGFTEAFVALDDRCLRVVVADENDERVQGLRAVDGLDPYDAMLFVFDAPSSARFTMADTLIALDIGWYDSAGALVDRTTMQPCPGTEAECPTYAARGPYRYALETEAGALGAGGIGGCPG